MDKIELLNFSSEIEQNLLFSLLKSKNSLTNLGIISKIRQFTHNNDFFSYYTNINAKSFDLFINKMIKKSTYYIKRISRLKDLVNIRIESDKYISIISSLIILYYMQLKYQKLINLISDKIEKIISFSNENNLDFHELHEKILELSQMRKNQKNFSRCSTKHNTTLSINTKIKKVVSTPKFFECKDKVDEKNNIFLSFGLENENENNLEYQKSKRIDSFTSFSNMVFSSSRKDDSPKKTISDSKIRKHSRACSVDKMNIPYVTLLNLSNEMFKKKIINSNEKFKMKELIIGNDQRLLTLCKSTTNRNVEDHYFRIKNYLVENK